MSEAEPTFNGADATGWNLLPARFAATKSNSIPQSDMQSGCGFNPLRRTDFHGAFVAARSPTCGRIRKPYMAHGVHCINAA
jgi:hypothetical protein